MEARTVNEGTAIRASSYLLGTIYLLTGSLKLAGLEVMVESFRNWGYSVAFMYVIGALEIAGAAMLFAPRLRVYGAIWIAILMIGATFTHILAGEWMMAPGPFLMLAFAATIAWAERGFSRRRERHA